MLILSKHLVAVLIEIAFFTSPRLVEAKITVPRIIEDFLVSNSSPAVRLNISGRERIELLNRLEEAFIQVKAAVTFLVNP